MSTPRSSTRRRLVRGALATGGAAVAAGWALQHRLVAGTRVAPDAFAAEGLDLPQGVVHHEVEVDDGGRIHVMEAGRGPTVVLLHGFMLSGALWVHQLRDLATSHRVLALDLRGHGRSVPGSAGFSDDGDPADAGTLRAEARLARRQQGSPAVRRMARDVLVVLRALEVTDAVVVGHSMGGMVTLQLLHDATLEERGRRVGGAVLVSTTGGPFSRLPGYGRAARLAGPISARAMDVADRWAVRTVASDDVRWWLTRTGFGADASPVQVRFAESLHLATAPSTVAALLPALAVFDLSRWLGGMELPVLVVVGTHDRLTPPRHARRTAGALPRAELV
ncbi:MAG TPA: alpha/beta hydrolase, partial [Acidimicrobiales bacterium]|nr:alpha/beta hydrolase [Acidimicrobiales bacterium]